MKKRLLVLICFLLIIAIGVFIITKNRRESIVLEVPHEGSIDEETDLPELKMISQNGTQIFDWSDNERQLFQDEQLIALEYFKDVYRFSYIYDSKENIVSFVYEDSTFVVDLTTKSYMLNYEYSMENDLIEVIGDKEYLNLRTFESYFKVANLEIKEPFYILEVDLSEGGSRSTEMEESVESLPDKINMTWEAVYSAKTDVSKLYDMPGLDIISPVWFDLKSGEGTFSSKVQEDYILWSNLNFYDLWPAVTNSFDTDLTRDLLTSTDGRKNFINDLRQIYTNNRFPGINIDFENIYKEDKDLLTHFIAELTAAFHRAGIIVSMDVTFPGGSDTWSKCYDHKKLGEWVDYLIIMSYDQHWGSSPISGTVAGLDWLNMNIPKVVDMVPAEKIIMGIPFYMRVWFERPSDDFVNQMRVTSDAITMHRMENILKDYEGPILWDEITGQYYISFINHTDNAVNKIWIEDERSLALKVDLVHKYKLKGIASWRRGYELESIWPMLKETLKER
jgi:spore germination protein YaaH